MKILWEESLPEQACLDIYLWPKKGEQLLKFLYEADGTRNSTNISFTQSLSWKKTVFGYRYFVMTLHMLYMQTYVFKDFEKVFTILLQSVNSEVTFLLSW